MKLKKKLKEKWGKKNERITERREEVEKLIEAEKKKIGGVTLVSKQAK